MDQFINGIDQVSSLYWNFVRKKHFSLFLYSQFTLDHTFGGFGKKHRHTIHARVIFCELEVAALTGLSTVMIMLIQQVFLVTIYSAKKNRIVSP